MKTKIILAVAVVAFLIGVNAALAGHDHGKHKGWDRDGHPHQYASPRPHGHP